MSEGERAIRVVLVDDQELVRAGFRALLDAEDGVEVVAEAGTGDAAVAAVVSHRPDVVLMDIRMPHVDGIEAIRHIRADDRLDDTKVVVLTTHELDEYIVDALHAGANGFLLKDVEPDQLRRAVHAAARGDAVLSPSVTSRVISVLRSRPTPKPAEAERLATLTDREREVVALVGQGLNNAEIGRALHMSQATAKTHVSRAMTKLHMRDRVQLAVLAIEAGLVRR